MKKINWNDKYTTIAAYVIIVFLILGLLFVIFFKDNALNSIFQTILSAFRSIAIGVIIAYFLNRPTNFFENKVYKFKKPGRKMLSRVLSITSVYFILVVALVGFGAILVPQITSGYKDLSSKMPMYIESITSWLNAQAEKSSIISNYATKIIDFINNLLNNTYDIISNYIPDITSFISNLAGILKDVGLGLIVSIYFLGAKSHLIAQFKKLFIAIFKQKLYDKIQEVWSLIDKSFGGFVIGKIFDSTIIGLISLAVLAAMGAPYYPLISIIIAITNIVPIFGPLIGGVIGGFIILLTNSDLLIWFIIFDILLQQFDGNYLGPKILGQSVGISATWIFVSITVFGALFGFPGMLFGVPIAAVIYTLLKQWSEKKLAQKQLPTETYDYISTDTGREIYNEAKLAKEKKQINKEKRKEFFKKIISKVFKRKKNQVEKTTDDASSEIAQDNNQNNTEQNNE